METTPSYIIETMLDHIERCMARIKSARSDIAGYEDDIRKAQATIDKLSEPARPAPAPRGTKYTAAFDAARRIVGETDEPVSIDYLADRIMEATGCKTTYAHDAIRNICYAGHAIMLGNGRGATIMKTDKTKENNA